MDVYFGDNQIAYAFLFEISSKIVDVCIIGSDITLTTKSYPGYDTSHSMNYSLIMYGNFKVQGCIHSYNGSVSEIHPLEYTINQELKTESKEPPKKESSEGFVIGKLNLERIANSSAFKIYLDLFVYDRAVSVVWDSVTNTPFLSDTVSYPLQSTKIKRSQLSQIIKFIQPVFDLFCFYLHEGIFSIGLCGDFGHMRIQACGIEENVFRILDSNTEKKSRTLPSNILLKLGPYLNSEIDVDVGCNDESLEFDFELCEKSKFKITIKS